MVRAGLAENQLRTVTDIADVEGSSVERFDECVFHEETQTILLELLVIRLRFVRDSEADRNRVLKTIRGLLQPGQMVFVGVIDPINPKIETPQGVRDRVMEAAEIIPLELLGTTDDCGFSPFADGKSTSRETAFAKIQSRVEGTAMAGKALGVS